MCKIVRLITALMVSLVVNSPVYAEATISPVGGNFIEGSYIVTFKEPTGTDLPFVLPENREENLKNPVPFGETRNGQTKEGLEKTLGTNGKIKYIFSSINAINILMDAKEAQRLSADPRVLRVDQDGMTTATTSVAQSADYNGIWQEQNHPERYYSIRVKDNTVVLIDLAGLETSRHTLQAAYSGILKPTEDGIVRGSLVVLSENSLYSSLLVTFESEDKGYISFICSGELCTASAAVVGILKIF